MTMQPHAGSGALEDLSGMETGLEDFTMEDAVVPRLAIKHRDGEFEDSLSGTRFKTVEVILLGLVKQRILWYSILDEDGDKPMCRSQNHTVGYPNLDEDVKKEKRFPWDKSGFRPEDFAPDENGLVPLPCEGCQLKEWGSHPDGKKPYCAEQFTIPLLYDPYGQDNWVPAILTLQKTGIKPIRNYFTSFARSGNPAFTARTEIGLTLQKRGGNDYSVPWFKRLGDTEPEEWRGYALNFSTLKKFLTAAPVPLDEDGETPAAPADNVARPPAAAQQTVKAEAEPVVETPPPAAEPVAEAPAAKAEAAPAPADDDLPF